MIFIPLGNRVALRRVAIEADSNPATSMFAIPDAAKEKPLECEVVAVPTRGYLTEFGATLLCPVKVGDRVLVGKYTAGEHKVRGEDGKEEEILYLRWEELLAVAGRKVEVNELELGLPSAADLDRVTEERRAAETTA